MTGETHTPPPPSPRGPLLLAGTRSGRTVTLAAVGMLLPEGLAPVPPEVADHTDAGMPLGPGSKWTLFADGTRVGSVTIETATRDPELCGASPLVSGEAELQPTAAEADRFLALPAELVEARGDAPYRPLDHTYQQRVGLLRLAGEALPAVGGPWPPQGMLSVRRDMQAFRTAGASGPSAAATFAYLDALDLSPAPDGAYALFMIAEEEGGELRERFTWYRPAEEGKAVPRLFSHLDWKGDGTGQVLLEVLGEGRRWFVALDREGAGAWTEVFSTACADPTDR